MPNMRFIAESVSLFLIASCSCNGYGVLGFSTGANSRLSGQCRCNSIVFSIGTIVAACFDVQSGPLSCEIDCGIIKKRKPFLYSLSF